MCWVNNVPNPNEKCVSSLNWLPWLHVESFVTVHSSVTSVEAGFVDKLDGLRFSSVEEQSFVVGVPILLLQALLQHLVALP